MLEESYVARVAFDKLRGVLGAFLRKRKERPSLDRPKTSGNPSLYPDLPEQLGLDLDPTPPAGEVEVPILVPPRLVRWLKHSSTPLTFPPLEEPHKRCALVRGEERIDLMRRPNRIVLPGQQRDVRELRFRPQGTFHRGSLRLYYSERSPRAVIAFHKLDVGHPA